ncbi:PorV/PorQ family protein [bacterium]|nr:PorV/PorQ family protein [bacterium]
MNGKKLFLVAVTLLMVIGVSLTALAGNPEKKGTASAEELLIPVGARGIALGGATAAYVSGIDAIYWNPAGVARTDQNLEANFSYMKYIADINVTNAALITKTGFGHIGFSFQSLSFGDIAETTEDQPNGTGRFYSPAFMTIGLTYARAMSDRIFVGVNAKFISETIMEASASTFAVDMGVQYKTSYGVQLGVLMKNFGAPARFSGRALERTVDVPDVPPGSPTRNLAFKGEKFELPSSFEMALAYEMAPMEQALVTFCGTYRHNNFLNDQLCAGIEASYDNMFFLRAGYDYALNEGEDVAGGQSYTYGPNFGFGLLYPLTTTMKMAFDFAYRTTTDYFDNNLVFSATMLF